MPSFLQGLLRSPRTDLPAGLVVFLVAVPLCLGIAQASGAPLFSGLIAGVVGGIVVGSLSGSNLSVSGPAAGLAVIVASGIEGLGLRGFLLAVVIAGALQVAMGLLRLGAIAHFFPSAVIKGMLAAIGVLIVLKQLPHALGYDKDQTVDSAFRHEDGSTTFSAIADAFAGITPAAVGVTLLCAAAMFLWPKAQRSPATRLIPPALIAVLVGGLASVALAAFAPGALAGEHLVSLPRFSSASELFGALIAPEFGRIGDPAVWKMAATLAIVASLETLLSLEASDRLDPHRRISPPNRELLAQGVGNLASGLIGGLPVTSVIVRSSANILAGATSRLSTIFHGTLLLFGVLFLVPVLNRIPLAALAVVLIAVGWKLCAPKLWKSMWAGGPSQFVPFASTIAAVVFTDLLTGTLLGVVVGLFFMIRQQQRNAVAVETTGGRLVIRFTKDITFLQKARVKDVLRGVPDEARVAIDRSRVDYVDEDIEELLREFVAEAPQRSIAVEVLR